jgi:hypothetical protein
VFEFDWDEANLAHIARHAVTRAEVEEVFAGPMVFINPETEEGEIRIVEIGRTVAGKDNYGDSGFARMTAGVGAREANEYLRDALEQA